MTPAGTSTAAMAEAVVVRLRRYGQGARVRVEGDGWAEEFSTGSPQRALSHARSAAGADGRVIDLRDLGPIRKDQVAGVLAVRVRPEPGKRCPECGEPFAGQTAWDRCHPIRDCPTGFECLPPSSRGLGWDRGRWMWTTAASETCNGGRRSGAGCVEVAGQRGGVRAG